VNLIRTPFGFRSTATDVLAGVDLAGRRIVVTGASSGIGAETARTLANAGAEVTLAVRNVADGERFAVEVVKQCSHAVLRVARLDLTDMDSIAAFVESWVGPLHGITANALMPGAILTQLQRHTGGKGSGRTPAEWFTGTNPASFSALPSKVAVARQAHTGR
jgi:NAD(P)-dependent dehydrogenase (short-subunit alcohol dehydrogenase family)